MEESDIQKDKVLEANKRIEQLASYLGIPKHDIILAINPVNEINLGGNIQRNNVYEVKVQGKNKKTYSIICDKEINPIAKVDSKGKMTLSNQELEKWSPYIGTKGNQNAQQRQLYDFAKDYYMDELNKKSQDLGKDNKAKADAARSLGVDESAIISMTLVVDKESFGKAIGKDLKADTYIIRYGNNKTKVMQTDKSGGLKEIAGTTTSEFNMALLDELNLDKQSKNQKINPGDIRTIQDTGKDDNIVIVRENDSDKGIAIVTTTADTKVYTFDDEGKETVKELHTAVKYELDEKGKTREKHEAIEEETIDEEEEEQELEEDDEDRQRTPWGDAEARRRGY